MTRRSHRAPLLGAFARLLALACLAPAAAAQQPARPDSARATTLPPVDVHASIAPTASPSVGSGIPARISTISGTELQAWHPRVLPDVLGEEAGVSIYDDLGAPWKLNISTRGFTAGPTVGTPPGVSVFLDGIRQNEADAQEVNFDLLPLDHVERVELLSGTASLLGPNSLGGAINLISERGSGPMHGELETTAGSFGAYSGEASMSGKTDGGWDYYASGGAGSENGWRQATGDHNYNAFLNVGHSAGDRGFRVEAYAARSRARTAGSIPQSMFSTPRINFTPGDFDDINAQQLSLSAYAPVGAGQGTITLYGHHSNAQRFNVNQAPDPNVDGFTRDYTVGGTADWRWTRALGPGTAAFRLGADGTMNWVRVRIFNEAHNMLGLTTDVRSPSSTIAGYALGDYRVKRVTLSAGTRTDYISVPFNDLLAGSDSTSAFSRVSPRGGVSVDIGHGALLYGSIGEAFRAPAILELGCADPTASCPLPFALGDDPPLKPVVATTYELGGRWIGGPILFDASLYRTNVRDEIFFVESRTSLVSGYFTSLDRTRREGVEVSVRGYTLDDRLDWYANYAYTRATFESPAELFSTRADDDFTGSPLAGPNDVQIGDRMPLVPDHQVKAGGTLALTDMLGLGIDARYTGQQWLRGDEANETRPLAGYAVVNGRATARIQSWEIEGVVDNVFDNHAAVFGTFNENVGTGQLERFLTPLNARTFSVTVRRMLGPTDR